jgi:hypothetical protein
VAVSVASGRRYTRDCKQEAPISCNEEKTPSRAASGVAAKMAVSAMSRARFNMEQEATSTSPIRNSASYEPIETLRVNPSIPLGTRRPFSARNSG